MTTPQLGVVTLAGISAAIDAGNSGPQIKITGFRIGSMSAAEGAQALETDTDVDGFVYEGTAEQMRYSRVDEDTVVWRISLNQDIGNFVVGNIGLMQESGVMFAKAVMVGPSTKTKSNPPAVVGNRKFYNIVLVLTNISNALDLSIVESLEASLPEVPTELDLPDPITTPYNTYLVLNHTHIGEPTVAVRRNDKWHHRSQYVYPNQGVGVMACVPEMYHEDAIVGKVVHYDAITKEFVLADGNDPDLQPDGVRTSDYEMTVSGMIGGDAVGLTLPLTPGTVYYAGTGVNEGTLVTTEQGVAVAIAISTKDIWLNLGGRLNIDGGLTNDPTITITIDPDLVDPTLPAGTVVFLNGTSRIWQKADPLDATKRPVGILNADKTKVVLLGKLIITAATASWPKPLTAGALYYADTGSEAGKITATATNRWVVGSAFDANTLIVNFEAFATDNEHLAANAAAVTSKGATPKGVKGAIDEHAATRNHPSATTSALGFGRPATDQEVLDGEPAASPAYQYPWVTPQQLAEYPFPTFDGSGYVQKSGSTMNANADLVFQGTGAPKKNSKAYWHPDNDGESSGLDADLLDGIQSDKFVRNDRDAETTANGKVKFLREVAEANRGIVRIHGRDANEGGSRLEFYNGAGDVLRSLLVTGLDGRSLSAQLLTDNGATLEDQMRLSDDGDLWLRKFNAKLKDVVRVYFAVVAGTNNLVASSISPPMTAYAAGDLIICKLVSANTGPMTFNGGPGVKDLYYPGGAAIGSGAGVANAMIAILYDGTGFQVLGGINSDNEDFPVGSKLHILAENFETSPPAIGTTKTGAQVVASYPTVTSTVAGNSLPGTWKLIMAQAMSVRTTGYAVGDPPSYPWLNVYVANLVYKRISQEENKDARLHRLFFIAGT